MSAAGDEARSEKAGDRNGRRAGAPSRVGTGGVCEHESQTCGYGHNQIRVNMSDYK